MEILSSILPCIFITTVNFLAYNIKNPLPALRLCESINNLPVIDRSLNFDLRGKLDFSSD